MLSSNNSLIKRKESFFKKVISRLKDLFRIKHNSRHIKVQTEMHKQIDAIDTNKQDKKVQFFEMYHALKSGNIDIQTLSYNELKQFNAIIEEENKLKIEKLKNLKEENNMIMLDIKKQEEEKKKLKRLT